jgi:hypothetical protein
VSRKKAIHKYAPFSSLSTPAQKLLIRLAKSKGTLKRYNKEAASELVWAGYVGADVRPGHMSIHLTDGGAHAILKQQREASTKKNRGTPPSKQWAKQAVKRPGKLGGKGFMSRPVSEQKSELDRCVRKYGYRSCLGSVMFLRNVSSSAAQKQKAQKLQKYLQDKYGERPSRKNPDDGTWVAVVEVLQGYRLSKVRLTPAQQQQLSRMTG